MTKDRKLVEELIAELGVYLQIRLSIYIACHAEGSKGIFLNEFIVCPELDEFHSSCLRPAIHAKQHFQDFMNSDILDVTIEAIQVTDDFSIDLHLSMLPLVFDDEDDDADPIHVTLSNSELRSINYSLFLYFEAFDDDVLAKFIRKVRVKTSFDALKGS